MQLTKGICQSEFYLLKGEVKGVREGKIYLVANEFSKKYYGNNSIFDSSKITEGKFYIKRKKVDSNSYAYRFYVQADTIEGTTGLVIIEPKEQYITIDSLNDYVSPIIMNSIAQCELKNEYEKFFMGLIKKGNLLANYMDSLYKNNGTLISEDQKNTVTSMRKTIESEGDSLFVLYSLRHPNSYVALWKLIGRVNNYGYKPEYLQVYKSFSKDIKKCQTARILFKDMAIAKLLAVNEHFPKMNLKNIRGKQFAFDATKILADYTLIDYWFSHCGPCLIQFPAYKKVYEKYKRYGFEMVGISVDRTADLGDWKNVILQKKLNWTEYLDENGKESTRLNIISFPRNFLINSNGIIIKKNISADELDDLLSKEYNSQ